MNVSKALKKLYVSIELTIRGQGQCTFGRKPFGGSYLPVDKSNKNCTSSDLKNMSQRAGAVERSPLCSTSTFSIPNRLEMKVTEDLNPCHPETETSTGQITNIMDTKQLAKTEGSRSKSKLNKNHKGNDDSADSSLRVVSWSKRLIDELLHKLKSSVWCWESWIWYEILYTYRRYFSYSTTPTLDDIRVLYDSPHYFVVEKRYDVLINSADRNPSLVTVEKQLERLYPDLVNPNFQFSFYFCHRLDYATSGVLLMAKHKKACSMANRSFHDRTAQKFYLAILRGHVDVKGKSGSVITIKEGIGNDGREKFQSIRMATNSMSHCETDSARRARTYMAVLELGMCHGYPGTKVMFRPITGRRHQLRLHANSLGHTIVGDYTYSNRRDIKPYRMFLHAYCLRIKDALEPLDVCSEDPFVQEDKRNHWMPHEKINTVEEAMLKLSKR